MTSTKPLKFVMLGESKVGKTSIFNRLSKDKFSETYSTTVGCDMTTYYIKYKNNYKKVKIKKLSIFFLFSTML